MADVEKLIGLKNWQWLGAMSLLCLAGAMGMSGFGITFAHSVEVSAVAGIMSLITAFLSFLSYQKAEDRRLERERMALELLAKSNGQSRSDMTEFAIKDLMGDKE